jgi:hypothetical protein
MPIKREKNEHAASREGFFEACTMGNRCEPVSLCCTGASLLASFSGRLLPPGTQSEARADQYATAQEGKEKGYGRDGKSKLGGAYRIMQITASKDQREHQKDATEAQPDAAQYPTEREARGQQPRSSLPPPKEELAQVNGHRQHQCCKQHRGHDGSKNSSLESLAQELPASREGGGIIRRGSTAIRIVGLGISEKQAQANSHVAEKTDEGEEKTETRTGDRCSLVDSGGGSDLLCLLMLTTCSMQRWAHSKTGLLMGADERQAQSQNKTRNEGKSEA